MIYLDIYPITLSTQAFNLPAENLKHDTLTPK